MNGTSDVEVVALDEKAFRRAFRFHPRTWREENETAAASVLMDVAEASGRTKPKVADNLSIQAHAMNMWLRRVIRPDIAETVASLALGTGFALALFHLVSFEVIPVIQIYRFFSENYPGQDAFPYVIFSISNTVIVCLWIAAAVAVVLRKLGAARRIAFLVLLACLGVCVIRLGPKDLLIESILIPVIFGAWAALASLSRVKAKLVWRSAAVVGGMLGLLQLLKLIIDRQLHVYAPAFWELMAPFLALGLVLFFVVLVTVAMCGATRVAIVGAYYAAPWSLSMLGGYVGFNLNLSASEFAIATGIWILATAGVFVISWFMESRSTRAID